MKLKDLFTTLSLVPPSELDPKIELASICNDARKVTEGSVFVAIKGVQLDGHTFIPSAIGNGAVALVVEDKSHIPEIYRGHVLQVRDCRQALDLLACQFSNNPGDSLFVMGVTGTNGKTSVCYMAEAILNKSEIPTGVVGTVNHHLLNRVWPSDMTTPDPIFLQARLREFLDAGAKAVAMEVSSHALSQSRANSVPFDTVVFTNLSRDHLDYHKTMEHYFEAKNKMFQDLIGRSSKKVKTAIINGDDEYGRKIKVAPGVRRWTYGLDPGHDLSYEILSMEFAKTEFLVRTPEGEMKMTLPMSGEHNIMNALAAIGVGLSAGVSLATCAKALENFTGVPGRLETVPNNKHLSVFVDYAHTPDALENVLNSLARIRTALKSSARIWTVFGCGGDRDKGKRPMMAEAASKGSDFVIVTSDNPRSENPHVIIEEIMSGFDSLENVKSIEDRKTAIEYAIHNAIPGDVILIAGKGHEDYQIVGQTKYPFSDVEVAAQTMK